MKCYIGMSQDPMWEISMTENNDQWVSQKRGVELSENEIERISRSIVEFCAIQRLLARKWGYYDEVPAIN